MVVLRRNGRDVRQPPSLLLSIVLHRSSRPDRQDKSTQQTEQRQQPQTKEVGTAVSLKL